MTGEPVVVGVDGGETALAAARWAAAEAARRGAGLHVLLAYHWRVPAVLGPRGGLAETAQDLAEMVAADAARRAADAVPGVDVQASAVLGQPADVLLHAAEGAGLLVVGTRGRHEITGTFLGSVSQQVTAHAAGPVAVVRGRPDPSGDVLVGVDGSEPSDAALELAFAEATRWGSRVAAVRALEVPIAPPSLGTPPLLYDVEETRRSLCQTTAAHVAAVGERHPGVPWEFNGIVGDAAEVLTERSARCRIVVVGNRGHGGFRGLLLGSVGLRLLHRAECPVLVAHAPAPGAVSGASADAAAAAP
ncbi:universal stress protein [Dactylosporangium sp. CA-233914]|uniref:universal stress protein n=1 Tax=Dactylosporangium sp. CA-233914 TaxID=3239934 RepID=UPI003D92CB69